MIFPLTRAFEHESNSVAAIVSLDGNNIIVSSTLEHLGHVIEVHPHGNIPIAAIVLETLGSEEQRHQSNMARVHGLKGEPRRRTVEVGISDQIFDRLENLLQKTTLHQP
ncbi:hypothetical protein IEQ34_012442 [Dendrobium chrysotoxum]|uniref:Uncharacterized protein n=1 Tax=Dendrobium chrysotoxum TaxID=161865 RepID=A0AAV7GVD6_DENCH|nr:hypothetical protein IEQ34_012442 [Dendrobium chrysotoxum]